MVQKSVEKRGVWKHARRAAWRKVSDEAIILDAETANYYSLSGPGLRMWELLGKGKTVTEIARELAEEFDASEDRILEDCAELVGTLKKEKLIERA